MKIQKAIIPLSFGFGLAACGGDGGSSNPPAPPEISVQAPTEAAAGAWVALDASATTDPNGDAITYTWTQEPGGPTVELDLEDPTRPKLTVPNVSEQQTVTFTLTASDGELSSTGSVSLDLLPFGESHVRLAWIYPEGSEHTTLAFQRLGEDGYTDFADALGIDGLTKYVGGVDTAQGILLDNSLVVSAPPADDYYNYSGEGFVYRLDDNTHWSISDTLKQEGGMSDDEQLVRLYLHPVSKRIVAITREAVYAVGLDGSNSVKLFDNSSFIPSPRSLLDYYALYSPDGARLAMFGTLAGEDQPAVVSVPLDGSAPPTRHSLPFTDVDGDGNIEGRFRQLIGGLKWSANSKRLGFLADYNEDDELELHVTDIESGLQQRVSDPAHVFDRLAPMWNWHPDSDRLAYSALSGVPDAEGEPFLTSFSTAVAEHAAPVNITADSNVNILTFRGNGKWLKITSSFAPTLAVELADGSEHALSPERNALGSTRSEDALDESGAYFYTDDADGVAPRIFVSEPDADRYQVDITPSEDIGMRLNNANSDNDGRFYFIGGAEGDEPLEALYRIDKAGNLEQLANNLPDEATEWYYVSTRLVAPGTLHLVASRTDEDGDYQRIVTLRVDESTGEVIETIDHSMPNGNHMDWLSIVGGQ